MKTLAKASRTDRCYLLGCRGARLHPDEASLAWYALSESLRELGAVEMPKFRQLIDAYRKAIIEGKKQFKP